MGTKITDTSMTSTSTRHTATMNANGTWSVSWLPGRTVTRNQAITAMTLAEAVAQTDLTDNQHRMWPHIDGWAAELDLYGPHAAAEASLSPEDHVTDLGGQLEEVAAAVLALEVRLGELEEHYVGRQLAVKAIMDAGYQRGRAAERAANARPEGE